MGNMREIKFRGKCLESGELVYGDLIHGVGVKSGNIYILPSKINLAYVKNCDPLDGVRVDSDSCSQFTGLKDKKGVEIYEGDIVNVDNNEPEEHGEFDVVTVCKWDIGGFILEDNAEGHWTRQLYHKPYRLTVIGNIYQNPELLNN
jgi:uncharacterized phage protein (TIGR01671 family)